MSDMMRNKVHTAYIHKAEHHDERNLNLQFWAVFLGDNREKEGSHYDFAGSANKNNDSRRFLAVLYKYSLFGYSNKIKAA